MPEPFIPIHIALPDILRGIPYRFTRCTLRANGLPVAIRDGHGLMLRLTSRYGYEGLFTCWHLDVHDQDGLLTIRVKGALRGSSEHHTVELLHVESRHDATGPVAQTMQVATAERRTAKTNRRTGQATFLLELFRPEIV